MTKRSVLRCHRDTLLNGVVDLFPVTVSISMASNFSPGFHQAALWVAASIAISWLIPVLRLRLEPTLSGFSCFCTDDPLMASWTQNCNLPTGWLVLKICRAHQWKAWRSISLSCAGETSDAWPASRSCNPARAALGMHTGLQSPCVGK